MQSDQAPRPLDNWNRYAGTNPDNVIYFVKKLEQRESMSLLLLSCILAEEPLKAGLEGSPDIAIDQQIDHHDEGNNPTTDNGKEGMGLLVAKKVKHDIDNL